MQMHQLFRQGDCDNLIIYMLQDNIFLPGGLKFYVDTVLHIGSKKSSTCEQTILGLFTFPAQP